MRKKIKKWIELIDSEPVLGFSIGFSSGFVIMVIALLAIIIGAIL